MASTMACGVSLPSARLMLRLDAEVAGLLAATVKSVTLALSVVLVNVRDPVPVAAPAVKPCNAPLKVPVPGLLRVLVGVKPEKMEATCAAVVAPVDL